MDLVNNSGQDVVGSHHSHASPNNCASFSRCRWSSASKPFSTAQSMSMMATVFHIFSQQFTFWRTDALVGRHLPIPQHGHYDLTPRVAIASDMIRILGNVRHKLSLLTLGCRAAHTSAERDRLACHFAMKGAQD